MANKIVILCLKFLDENVVDLNKWKLFQFEMYFIVWRVLNRLKVVLKKKIWLKYVKHLKLSINTHISQHLISLFSCHPRVIKIWACYIHNNLPTLFHSHSFIYISQIVSLFVLIYTRTRRLFDANKCCWLREIKSTKKQTIKR